MPRPPKFTNDQILDAALELVAAGGPAAVTIDAIAARIGGNVGSIYHRFSSKDLILATLWLRSARHGQEGFRRALGLEDVDEATDAALRHYPTWVRANLPAARLLALYGREQLAAAWPDELGGELAVVNDETWSALREFAVRRYGRAGRVELRAVTFALVDVPTGAVRRYLIANQAPPASLDRLVRVAALAALATVGAEPAP